MANANDNLAICNRIAQLEAILDSGTTSGNIDGQSVTFASPAEIRKRIKELQSKLTGSRGRSIFTRVRMGGV